ncbi:ABC transporter ATP-binding protein [Rhodoferax saidenbachensis]|uniref:Sulfonate transport system ATP-binding protein n=1 Tax=Rhodoferax saidenbachensis TaxID=1484693 RepID=A0ABU1ZPE3_9BURK|nr:ABC transporter ATP-binding protein [Rhodoferax saidenbachensis]MDR7307429.1 sulfonate transport system ATP-binding protein [Rhodoferax saidenbachensis]
MSAVLEARIQAKHFGSKHVLAPIQLQIAAGEVVSLVGASGSGKSTLLRIVAGLERAFSGEVSLDGQRLTGRSPDIGFIFQEPRLFPWLSVADNVAFAEPSPTAATRARVSELLTEVGLAGYEAALPKELSGGQAQRVAIARGLFTQPRVLLLDEPFSAVDAFTRMKLQDLLTRIARHHGITLLLVTHDIDEAVYLSDRVLVLEANPGTVRESVALNLPQPRDRTDPALSQARVQVLAALQRVHAI